MDNKLYYEQYPDKAVALANKQLTDGWSMKDIEEYFYALGYDVFFVRNLKHKLQNENKTETT